MCKNNVAIHPHFIDEATMTSIIEEVDVFLIPSMRVHSISVVRAMCNNVVPVVSDGWGFDEFVKHGETGIDCAGQLGFTSFNDDIFRSNYDVRANSSLLTHNIEGAIQYLTHNPEALKRMSAKAKNYAVETFDIKQRNKRLGEILTHVYTN
jgi:glycosyltransferase involved in cell wall biosynthesis